LDDPLAALISSSARHSAHVFVLRKAASRAPVVSRKMAWLTRRSGEMSTAWRRTTPAEPMRVASSRGPALMMASTITWIGFWSDSRCTISIAWRTMRTASTFLPLLRPCIISEFARRSTMGHCALRNRFVW